MNFAEMKVLDLSHPLEKDMPVYPGDQKPEFSTEANIIDRGFRSRYISLGTHTGTHIDAPAHLLEKGKYLHDYPLSQFIGKAKVIDCRDVKEIDMDHIPHLPIEDCPDFLLLYTNSARHWGQERYYKTYPVLTSKASQALASLPLKGIGIDAPSFDLPDSSTYQNHLFFLENNILLIENICNLEALPDNDFTFCCFPIFTREAEGSPTKACALIDK